MVIKALEEENSLQIVENGFKIIRKSNIFFPEFVYRLFYGVYFTISLFVPKSSKVEILISLHI